jgi:hypothetical protein
MDQDAIALIAETMLSLYGGQAIAELRQRAAAALDAGDEQAFQAWSAILKTARNRECLSTAPEAATETGIRSHAL